MSENPNSPFYGLIPIEPERDALIADNIRSINESLKRIRERKDWAYTIDEISLKGSHYEWQEAGR